jgi:Domain of unknown function (DUF2382)
MIVDEFKHDHQNVESDGLRKTASKSKILTEEVISLLEERLMVDITQRQIGEIVVRKEIETHIVKVEIPIRREKLIVEQVSPEYKRLAEVDLGQTSIPDGKSLLPEGWVNVDTTNDELTPDRNGRQSITIELGQTAQNIVYGEINSPRAARDLLDQITKTPAHDCETIRIEIVLKDSKHQKAYQALFDQYC